MMIMHRKTKTGIVYCQYCEKKHTHIGNLKQHLTGFVGKKCTKIPQEKQGQKYGSTRYKETQELTKETQSKNPNHMEK